MVSSENIRRLRFYFFRLRRASFSEVIHRCRERGFLHRLKNNPDFFASALPAGFSNKVSPPIISFPMILGGIPVEVISRLLNGHVATLGLENKDVASFERKWQKEFFATVKQEAADPDIRAVWEPARLQHLMLLLQHLDNDGCSAADHAALSEYVRLKLLEWLEGNPFPYGPHYISVMECGLRIPVFLRALLLLDNFEGGDYEKICTAIFQHGWLIRNRLSLYSSLGNHTVAECVGLVMAGAVFKEHDLCREWIKIGITLLEQECKHQILDDGGPVEQSFAYHRFVLDLYWLAMGFLEDNELHDCREMKQRVQQGEKFLQAIQKENESLPMFGDSDDGFAVGPGLAPVREILPLSIIEDGIDTFSNSGYSVFRHNNGLRVLFDHGPLGMEPLNNHGHADALAVFLSVADKDFLVDPGTFQYNGDPALRRYFKGTSAHNTVCIDGCDQARQLTGFIWEGSFTCDGRYEKTEDGRHMFSGWHDGYKKQKIGVTHYRTLLCGTDGGVVIEDSFEGTGSHEYALHFHLHPEVVVERVVDTLRLTRGSVCLLLEIDSSVITLLTGRQKPLAGWYSSAYGKMIPATTIRVVKKGLPEDVRFTTILRVADMVD